MRIRYVSAELLSTYRTAGGDGLLLHLITLTVRLACRGNRIIPEVSNYTTRKTQETNIRVPRTGFEPSILIIKQPVTYALG